MGAQRYIETSFWDDEFIVNLDPSEKLLYIYFMTNTLTNLAGVYKITVRRICFDTGFNEHTVNHIMQKFEEAGKVYKFGEYLVIKSWCKHQLWESSPKIKAGIIHVLKNLPIEILNKLVEIGYYFDLKAVYDTLSIPYPYPSNYLNLDLNLDLNLNNNQPTAEPTVLETEPQSFETETEHENTEKVEKDKPTLRSSAKTKQKQDVINAYLDKIPKQDNEKYKKCMEFMFNSLKKRDPKFNRRTEQLLEWQYKFAKFGNDSTRTADEIYNTLVYAMNSQYWVAFMFSPDNFTRNYDKLFQQMKCNAQGSPQQKRVNLNDRIDISSCVGQINF